MNAAHNQEAGFLPPAQGPTELSLKYDERWPYYADDEVAAAAAVLRSGRVNQWTGPEVFAFQDACTACFGGGYGVAVANGSVALELALRAFRIGPGDEVVVTPRSFVASAFCVMLVGATPVFADVDPDSGNITPQTITKVLTARTRAIIPVHLAGWPADMQAIMDLSRERGLYVIEDCAQAHGAEIGGRTVGSFGDAAAFSFCQDKIISTGGEGGFVSFQDPELWQWACSFKDHGKNWDKVNVQAGQPGMFRSVHDMVGTNWRLPGTLAAIGLAQLRKLDSWRDIRTRNAMVYVDQLMHIPGLRVPVPDGTLRHAFYKLHFQLDVPASSAGELRRLILARSTTDGLRLFSGSCSEVYREQAFVHLSRPNCPVARELGQTSLMVEVHPTLRLELLKLRAERLSDIIREVFTSGN